jgi:hypothetical protein
MPSCNTYTGNPNPPAVDPVQFTAELTAMVTNHLNSPSIIMWDIFNEGQSQAGTGNGVGQTNTAYLVQLAQTLDPSRLVNQASGWNWAGVGAVDDIHNYPDPGNPINNTLASVDGEFGSIGYIVPGHMWFGDSYAYGSAFTVGTTNALVAYYDYYVNVLVNYQPNARGGLNAGVYTEITDMETESAGLLTYDRLLKLGPSAISSVNQNAILAYNSITLTNSGFVVTTNFSFEQDATAPDNSFTEVPTGWTAFNEAASGDIGSQNAGGGDYTVFDPLASPAAGNQYCYVNIFNSSVTGGIYTDVGPMKTNTVYKLTVAIGHRNDFLNSPGIISLVQGNNFSGPVLASGGGLPATKNTWQDYSISFTNGSSTADLTIALSALGNGSTIQADFDNVILTSVPAILVPPPPALANPSFEQNVIPPDTTFGQIPTGWTPFNEAASGDIGSQNAGGGDYSVNNPLAPPADGNNYCYINLYHSPYVLTGLYQDLGALQANTTYKLTVAIGSRIDIQTLPGIISLLNGTDNTGMVLASTNGVPATQNTWQDYSVSVTTGASVSGDITVELWVDPTLTARVANGVNNVQGDFDKVRLTATPIVFNAPILRPPRVSGRNLILIGIGGTPNAGYTWLTATNLSAPVNWSTNRTGMLDGTGAFSNTIPINTATPATFFWLRMP